MVAPRFAISAMRREMAVLLEARPTGGGVSNGSLLVFTWWNPPTEMSKIWFMKPLTEARGLITYLISTNSIQAGGQFP
jgi:hypothetical protein